MPGGPSEWKILEDRYRFLRSRAGLFRAIIYPYLSELLCPTSIQRRSECAACGFPFQRYTEWCRPIKGRHGLWRCVNQVQFEVCCQNGPVHRWLSNLVRHTILFPHFKERVGCVSECLGISSVEVEYLSSKTLICIAPLRHQASGVGFAGSSH